MRSLIAVCLLAVPLSSAEPKRPQPKSAPAEAQELHAIDAAVMKQVVGLAGVTVEPKRAARAGGAGFEWVKSQTHRLFVLCDAQGHITELRGNGPWLSNEALAEVAKLVAFSRRTSESRRTTWQACRADDFTAARTTSHA